MGKEADTQFRTHMFAKEWLPSLGDKCLRLPRSTEQFLKNAHRECGAYFLEEKCGNTKRNAQCDCPISD